MMWNSTFCKISFPLVIVIFRTVSSTRFGISLYHGEKLFYKKCYFTSSCIYFFHKSGRSTYTLTGALICFITQPLSYTKKFVRISPICGCHWNWNILFWIIRKIDGGDEPPFLDVLTQMKLIFLWPNLAWKFAYKWVMSWFSKQRKGTSCLTMSQKDQMFWRKYTFGILKFKFQTDLNKIKKKNFKFQGFFETNRPVGAKPLKKCTNIIADSETFRWNRDFETWVGRWSNWNGGVILLSHYFLTNVVITG